MKARINGEEREIAADATVGQVVGQLDVPPTGIAVALDGAVVPRSEWDQTPVTPGGTLEVLTAMPGG